MTLHDFYYSPTQAKLMGNSCNKVNGSPFTEAVPTGGKRIPLFTDSRLVAEGVEFNDENIEYRLEINQSNILRRNIGSWSAMS